MTPEHKLELLGENAVFDLACSCGLEPGRTHGVNEKWIYPAALPDGGRVRMLKVLVDSHCQNDCRYCAQRAGRDVPRARFEPNELARIFDQMARAGLVDAVFLSSGLAGNAVRAMDRILATAEILRRRYRYRGFMHLKVLPGSERSQVERAATLAQRLSINLEAPGPERLSVLSERKDYDGDILQRMRWIADVVRDRRFRARGHTTQFVVGAAGESDAEIVSRVQSLYGDFRLHRAYYSKFSPVPDTPLEDREPVAFLREHRLYQADFLLRKYGFGGHEIPFGEEGNLSLEHDPKTAWARAHPEWFPLEVNRAAPEQLLRVPGLGPATVERITAARTRDKIRFLDDLRAFGARPRNAAPYLLFDGRSGERQLTLL